MFYVKRLNIKMFFHEIGNLYKRAVITYAGHTIRKKKKCYKKNVSSRYDPLKLLLL